MKKVELYYEILLKLVNKFLTKTTNFFKLILFYIYYNYTNHIVNTCCNKGELVVIVLEVIVKSSKSPKPMNYPCHIYRVIGHKMVDCSRFSEMQNLFKDKNVKLAKNQLIVIKKHQLH